MTRISKADAIYSAAWFWEQRCVGGGDSVLCRGSRLWSREHLVALRNRLVQNGEREAAAGPAGFLEKLRTRLEGAAPPLSKLAAEVIWLLCLYDSGMTGERKRSLIKAVWEWSGETLHQSSIDWGRDGGIDDLWDESSDLLREMAYVADLTLELQHELGNLPIVGGAYALVLDQTEGSERSRMRHVLLHLLFPRDFEPIPSVGEKCAIIEAFASLLTDTDAWVDWRSPLYEIDFKLARIRARLQAATPDHPVDFPAPELRARWEALVPETVPPLVPLPADWADLSPAVLRAIGYAVSNVGRRLNAVLLLGSILAVSHHRKAHGSASFLLEVMQRRRWGVIDDIYLHAARLATRMGPVGTQLDARRAASAVANPGVSSAVTTASKIQSAVRCDPNISAISTRHILGALLAPSNNKNAIPALRRLKFDPGELQQALVNYVSARIPDEDPAVWRAEMGLVSAAAE